MARAAQTALGRRRQGDAPGEAGVLVNVLGAHYLHTRTSEGGDLYLTAHGERYARQLQPRNWFETEWFRGTRFQLSGTCSIYTLCTRPVEGTSLPLVVKYNRIGMRVPIQTNALGGEAGDLEFNGPFEEFALVLDLRGELRGGGAGPRGQRMVTQVPLAIYAPHDRWDPEQLQRYEWRVANKVAQHPGVAIDIMREYILVYSYLPGLDAYEAYQQGLLDEAELHGVNLRAERALEANGFQVFDMKPEHVIVEPGPGGRLLRQGRSLRYGVVDYELMERTTEYYRELQSKRRTFSQLRRAPVELDGPALPAGLHHTTGLGVRYLHGRSESTGGLLWVTGENPELFDFFLPERWRTTLQHRLLDTHDTYFTTSKDNVRFVWKVCRVGELGEMAAFGPEGFRALAFGFNSPFEEFALAAALNARGVETITPLAIYRTGNRSGLSESRVDQSRYVSHGQLRTLDGSRALSPDYSYITIWEHWAGPRGQSARPVEQDQMHSLNVRQACEEGQLCEAEGAWLVVEMRRRLEAMGVEVIRLVATCLLVALDPGGAVVRNRAGEPEACLCNLQHLNWPPIVGGAPEGDHDPGETTGSVER